MAFSTLVQVLSWIAPQVGKYNCVRSAPFHPNIHTFGNVGLLGKAHAHGAWFATRMIDRVAYNGRNMRNELATGMAETLGPSKRILEVGCGAGTLTHELEKVETFNITAVDTSAEMIEVAAHHLKESTRLVCMNGVDAPHMTESQFDVAVMCMVMHELPVNAHEDMLQALIDSVQEEVWVVDIDPSYQPSVMMLTGEPYVLEYLKTIETTVTNMAVRNGARHTTLHIIPGHVRGWVIRKNKC